MVGGFDTVIRHNHSAQAFLFFDELRVFQCDFQGVVELFEHSRWRTFGRVQTVPDGQIEAGRVKAFAVTTAKPLSGHKLLKDYPTLNDMGMRGFNLTIWHGLYAPKGTPPAVLKQLNDALKIALKDPEFIKRQEGLGAVVVTDNRVEPVNHKAFVAAETAKLKTVIDAAGKYAD